MKSITWKIILLSVVVLILPIYLLGSYMTRTFDEFSRKRLEEQMIDVGFIVGEQYKLMSGKDGSLPDSRKTVLADAIRAYAERVSSRIQILSPEGVVTIDSATNSAVGLNVANRPEVRSALAGTYKARWALTDDGKYVFYYVPVPIVGEGRVLGVAYISRNTSPIIQALGRMISFRRLTTAAAVIIGILLAVILAYTLTSRLRRLTAATTAYARGAAPLRVEVRGNDEIAELAQAINRMAEEIQRTNRYNREFVSTVMHELKMPITAIKGAAELLEQGAFEKKEARDKFMGNIRFEADRLARLVWELNELTKLDNEGFEIQKEKTDYGACVRAIVDRFVTALDSPHADIKLSIPETQLPVIINAGRIEQVICNLLENAVRYTPAGGSIEVKVSAGPGSTVVTSVHDTGCGIQPSNIGKVFDKFFTTERKDKPKGYGSGLGLAIAKSIVENHQGRISAQSTPGKGSVFTFTLPLTDN